MRHEDRIHIGADGRSPAPTHVHCAIAGFPAEGGTPR